MASLEQSGWSRENFRLIGYGKGSVAQYKHSDATLRVYYQTLPTTFAQNSLYTGLLRKYQIDVSLRRPDIIFEFDVEKCDFKLLEIKRTQDKRYIVDKCFILAKMPHAILVVWEGVEGCEDVGDVVVLLNQRNYRQFNKTTKPQFCCDSQVKRL